MNSKFYTDHITPVDPVKPDFTLELNSNMFFIGSCFSTNLYKKFNELYLNAYNSPFGNVYNPISISNSLKMLRERSHITKESMINSNGLFQHSYFHSTTGNPDPETFLNNINRSIEISADRLNRADMLIITFGTAYVFEKDSEVVNNCHRMDKNLFNRRLLSVDEICKNLLMELNSLKIINPKLKVIITLSPVRHLRDNPAENSLSKALLRVSIDEISKQFPIYYFPSYEILLDELRDYRWYDKSLTHPSDEAVEYIISNFLEVAGSMELKKYITRIEKLNSMLHHKIINPESESSIKFIEKREKTLKNMKQEFKKLEKLQNIKSSQYL